MHTAFRSIVPLGVALTLALSTGCARTSQSLNGTAQSEAADKALAKTDARLSSTAAARPAVYAQFPQTYPNYRGPAYASWNRTSPRSSSCNL